MFRAVLRFRRAELLPKSGLASINPFVFGLVTGSVVVLFRDLTTRASMRFQKLTVFPTTSLHFIKMFMHQDIHSQALLQCYAYLPTGVFLATVLMDSDQPSESISSKFTLL